MMQARGAFCYFSRMLVAFLLAGVSAAALAFPTKPAAIIVPQAPGGANDVLARMVAGKLQEYWGLPVLVDGAEVIADGSIHVYGSLRGRALAGLADPAARIYCQKLEAELVSIAGVYLVSEQIDRAAQSRPVQIRLDGERLLIEPLGLPVRL